MTFFKILQQFLVPSFFVFILVLAGLLISLRRNKRKTGKILIAVGLSLYYLFSTTVVSDFLLSPLEKKYSHLRVEDINKADKIVLLLGGREADVLRGSEVLRLYNQQLTINNQQFKIIISGTNPLLPSSQEALGVKRFFVSRGLAEENIIIEGQSRNTWENIRNVKEIVGERPFFLVTSAYHMERAMKEFEKVGARPIPAPTDFKHTKSARSAEASRNANAPTRIELGYNILDFFPDAEKLRNTNLAFHEYFGILFYRFYY